MNWIGVATLANFVSVALLAVLLATMLLRRGRAPGSRSSGSRSARWLLIGLLLAASLGLSGVLAVRSLHSANVTTPNADDVLAVVESAVAEPERYTLVDMGAGDGRFMKKAMRRGRFRRVVGVELDVEIAARARARGVEVYEGDMRTFKLDSAHRPAVVYMFEPAWKLPDEEARGIYHATLEHLRAQGGVDWIVFRGSDITGSALDAGLARSAGWSMGELWTPAGKRLMLLSPLDESALDEP
jgi:hypothetical protein